MPYICSVPPLTESSGRKRRSKRNSTGQGTPEKAFELEGGD